MTLQVAAAQVQALGVELVLPRMLDCTCPVSHIRDIDVQYWQFIQFIHQVYTLDNLKWNIGS